MPHATLKLMPGVDQNRTLALNEAAISSSQLVRFVPDRQGLGLVQKLGGWTRFFPSNIGSVGRALWAWQDTNAVAHLGVGAQPRRASITSLTVNGSSVATVTYSGSASFSASDTVVISGVSPDGYNGSYPVTSASFNPATLTGSVTFSKASLGAATVTGATIAASDGLSVITSGVRTILTPSSQTQNVAVAFTTTIGSPTITVTAAGSNIYSSDTVYIETQVSVGGLVLFGSYPASFIDGLNQFQITARDAIGAPQAATSSVSAGGAVPVFAFTSGSSAVTVTLANHGYAAGDTFPVIVPLAAAGVTLSGNYQIQTTPTANTFTIGASNVASSTAVTGASWLGGVATVNHSGAQTFAAGDSITVASVNPGGYNATATVTSATSTSVSYAVAVNPGAYVSGGTIFRNTAKLNGGNVRMVYYKTPGQLPTSTGYGVGGYGVGGYGTGVTPTITSSGSAIYAADWSLDNWGQVFVSCPAGGSIFTWNPTAGVTQASIIPEAPPVNDGMFIAMPQRQIVAWGSTFTGVQDPLLIRWCDVDDYNQWVALPTNQAGSYRMPKGSKIVGCIQGPQQGLVWTDLACWAMQYSGPPYVYQFNEVGTGCGLISRKAAASMNGVVYWMSQSQFFRLAGSGVEAITCPIWDVIFQDLDTSNLDKIRIAPNSRFGEISWFYPTTASGGEIAKYVKYNVALNCWDFGDMARTAWINQSVLGAPIGAAPVGQTNLIYQHETSTDADNQPMTSNFQTGYFVMSDGEWKIFVDQVWPDMKWGYYEGAQDADLTITFYVKDYPHESARVYGPYSFNDQTDFLTPRFRGRLVSIKLESSDAGSFWRIGATRYRFQMDGKF